MSLQHTPKIRENVDSEFLQLDVVEEIYLLIRTKVVRFSFSAFPAICNKASF